MADKLDDMIAPDERVIYRVHRPWRELLWYLLLYAAMCIPMWLIWFWFPEASNGGEIYSLYLVDGVFLLLLIVLFLWIVASMALIAFFLSSRTTVVTDRRVLYSTGIFKPKVMEIPLADIEGVAPLRMMPSSGGVKIRLPTGKFVSPYFGWGSARLCAAIKARLGLPQPPEPTRKVFRWAGFIWALRPLSLFILLLAFIYTPLICILMSILEWLDPKQLSNLSILVVAGAFYLLIKIAMLVGNTLALCVVRAFLSAHEAKQLICLGYDPLSGDKWWDRMSRRRIRHRERLLSLLYGQSIRCADGE